MLLFIILNILLGMAFPASTPATISGFPTIDSGSLDVILKFQTPGSLNPNTVMNYYPDYYCLVTAPLKVVFKNAPNPIFGIIGITFDARSQTNDRQLALYPQSATATSFTFAVFVADVNIIQSVKINYIIFDSVIHTQLNSNFGTLNYLNLVNLQSGTGVRSSTYEISISNGPLVSGNVYGLLSWLAGFSAKTTSVLSLGMQLSYKNTANYTIKVDVNNDTSLYFLQWNRLFFDATTIQKTQVRFVEFGWVDGSSSKQNVYTDLPYYIESTYLVGVTKVQMSLQSGSDFTMQRSDSSTFQTLAGYGYLNFTYFNYRMRSCPTGYPQYSETFQMCYDLCPTNGFFLDQSINPDGLCLDCAASCLTCSDSNICATCDTDSHFVMNPSHLCQCDSANGYLSQTTTGLCKTCSQIIIGCISCTAAKDINCGTCYTPNYTLVFGKTTICECQSPFVIVDEASCVNCLDLLPGCVSCTTDQCDQCDENAFLTNVDGNCECLSGYYCSKGTEQSCYGCSICSLQNNRQFVDGACQCIPGYKICSTDGCDTSICHYSASDLNYSVTVTKDPNSNTLQYQLTFSPPGQQFQNIDWSKVISPGLPSSTTYQYSYNDGKVTIKAHYNEDLQGNSTTLTVDLQNSGLDFYSLAEPSSYDLTIEPQNNLAANFYDEDTYKGNEILTYVSYGIIGLGYSTFLIGLYSSKLVVTEMFGVLQLSYVSLLLLDYGDPLLSTLVNLRYFYGVDSMILHHSLISSVKLSSLFYSSLLINNINISFVLLAIPAVLGLGFFLLSIPKTRKKKRLEGIYKVLIGEYLLVAIEFILYNFVISVIAFVRFSQQLDKSSSLFYLSLTEIVAIGLFFVWNSLYFFFKNFEYFGEFKYLFKVSQGPYYYIPTLQRISLATVFMIGSSTYISAAIAIGVITVGATYVILVQPFTEMKHNFRSAFNSFCSVVVVTIVMMIKLNEGKQGQSVYTKLPYGIIGALAAVIIVSLYFVVKKLIQTRQKELKEKLVEESGIKTPEISDQVNEDYKKLAADIMNNPNSNNISKKLLLGRMKKNKKPRIRPTVETLNMVGTPPSQYGNSLPAVEQLSPEKIERVNEMLRQGLI